MAILLVLCVGAVSAADADMANGGISDISVSPVSDDISVLAEEGDDSGSDENPDNLTVNVSSTNISIPGNYSVEFNVDVKNGSDSVDFDKYDLVLTLFYDGSRDDGSRVIPCDECTLNNKTISFVIPMDVQDYSNFTLNILYKYGGGVYSASSNVTLRIIDPIIDIPDYAYVNNENLSASFDIKVLDVDKSITFSDKDLTIRYYDGTYILFLNNETLFKEGTNETVIIDGVRYIQVKIDDDNYINYTVSDYTTSREAFREVTDEEGNPVVDEDGNPLTEPFDETIYYPVAYILKNGVISFRVPNIEFGYELEINYTNQSVTPKNSSKNIGLKFVTSNKINVETTTQLEENKSVEFTITVTDKDGNIIQISQEDFELLMIYYGDNVHSNQIKIENFTLVPSKYTEIVDNETNETINVTTEWKILFEVPVLDDDNNYTYAKLNIIYKNNDEAEAFVTKNVAFVEIIVLENESSVEYQNAYLVVELRNNYLNGAVVAGKGVKFLLEGTTITYQQSTNETGIFKLNLDSLYIFCYNDYMPVGRYNVIVTSEISPIVGKNVTINIKQTEAAFWCPAYNQPYASGEKLKIRLYNNKTKTPIKNSEILLRVFFDKKTYQDVTFRTDSDGYSYIGLNVGAGVYNIFIYNKNSNVIVKNKVTNRLDSKFTITKIKATLSASTVTAYYGEKSTFVVKMVNANTKKALVGATVLLNIYTGKTFKAVQLTTNENGYAYYNITGLTIATHKVLIGSGSTGATASVLTRYIYLKKGRTIVTAPVVTNTYKQNQYLRITVQRYATKTALANVALTVKVYTGSKYVTYTVKTNANGVAAINTKALAKGTHKVVISSTNAYYDVSKSGNLIVIK